METANGPTDVTVIVVTYNVRELLLRCLDSLPAALDGLNADVWVVDNGSSDGTWDALLARTDLRALRGAPSLGFGKANNLAARHARGRHFLFLNPDTELPPGAVAALLRRLEADASLGIVGPRLLLSNGLLDPAARRTFPSPLAAAVRLLRLTNMPFLRRVRSYNVTETPEDQESFVDAVSGACMLVRGDAFLRVQGFDPGYFMYGEDLDLAYRLQVAGWRTLYFPDVQVRHWKRRSSRQRELRTRFEFYRAMWRFYHRHHRADSLGLRALVSAGIVLLAAGSIARRLAGRLLGRAVKDSRLA